MIADALQMMWFYVVLADIAQSLSDEAARPAGQGEIAPAIAAEDDLELAKLHARRCGIGVIHHLGGHLGIQAKPIGGNGFGRQNSEVLVSSHGRDNGVGSGACLPKNGMRMRGIVEAASNPANFAVAHEPRERHSDRARIAQVGEIVWRECPAAAFASDAPQDLPCVRIRLTGCFHVENNALFFQQIKRWMRLHRGETVPALLPHRLASLRSLFDG